MTRIHILSDLHLDTKPYRYTPPIGGADLVVIAGDVASWIGDGPLRFREFITEASTGREVVFVPGNHDHCGEDLTRSLCRYRDFEQDIPGFHLLDGDTIILSGLRIAGATLWTDFSLDDDSSNGFRAEAMIKDFDLIADGNSTLTWKSMAGYAARAIQFLEEEAPRSDLIITHFLPSPRSIHEKYQGHPLNSYFCVDLTDLLSRCAGLWIHGHAHQSVNYTVNKCQVVCNPRGYGDENPQFLDGLVAEITGQYGKDHPHSIGDENQAFQPGSTWSQKLPLSSRVTELQ